MTAPVITIRRATTHDHPAVSALLEHYYAEWDIWQRDAPATILDDLAHPDLGFLLAEATTPTGPTPIGCVLGRPLPSLANSAECKRLFVSPGVRGHRIAGLLMDALESAAAQAGFAWMYLDTKAEFAAAIALYRRRGYQDCPRYNDNPQATIFLRKSLLNTTTYGK